MPAKKEDLYHLIHSLSKAEKRYCSVEIAKGGSKTERYLQLLNAINKMDQFDDEALKEKSFVKSLPTDKIWLYDNLLKHLRNFRFEKSVQAQIHHSLEAAQILHEKNLETQALRLLE